MTAGKNKALIIGIDQYDSLNKLPYAKKDAAEVYRVLTDPDIGVFSKEDVVLLAPEENVMVSKSAVEQKLEEIFNEAGGDDMVLVYFAGHGKLDKRLKLRLAAQNTRSDRLVSTSISIETIRNIIENSDCRRAVFIIDSCYSGAAGVSVRSPEPITKSLEKSLEGEPQKGAIVISASQAFQEALEKDDIKQGIFTDFFIKGLESEEINHDEEGYISLDDIYNYTLNNVETQTKGKQVPKKVGNIDGKIIIAKSSKVIRAREEKIDKLLNSAKESLEAGEQEKAFDAYRIVLKLDPKNLKANEGITILIECMKEKLTEYQYQIGLDEKIETDIYNQAHIMLEKSYLSLSAIQKEYIRLILNLLCGLNLVTFEKDWRAIEVRERQEKSKQRQEEEERKQGGAERLQVDKPLGQQSPASASVEKVELKPEAPKQPLPDNKQRPTNTPQTTKTAQVFVSYAHEDITFLEKLKTMLDPLITDKTINFWDDSEIQPGDLWFPEIEKQLKTADIFVLLVSDEFLKSKFVKEKEMPSMIDNVEKRGVIFLWLLVCPCRWDKVDALKSREGAHLIKGQMKPLDSFSGSKQKKVLEDITRVIEEAAQRIVTMRANPNK